MKKKLWLLSCVSLPLFGFGQSYEFRNVFDDTAPTRLLSHTIIKHAAVNDTTVFSYDALGNLTNDELGNQLRYNGLGQMVDFTSVKGDALSHYRYNGLAQQYQQQVYKDQQIDTVQLYYNSGQLYNELSADGVKSYYYGEGLEAVLDDKGLLSYVNDQSHNVLMLAKVNNGQIVLSHNYVYSPYGISYDLNKPSEQVKLLADNAIGFNGERTDRVTGYQHLGQGTRAYNPILHRFMQMDGVGYSPFGQGGLNGYAYGLNNPMMNFDPSGHFSITDLFPHDGIGWGVFAGAMIASAALGAVTGGAGMVGSSALFANMIGGAAINGGAYTAETFARGQSFSYAALGMNVGLGLAMDGIGFAVGKVYKGRPKLRNDRSLVEGIGSDQSGAVIPKTEPRRENGQLSFSITEANPSYEQTLIDLNRNPEWYENCPIIQNMMSTEQWKSYKQNQELTNDITNLAQKTITSPYLYMHQGVPGGVYEHTHRLFNDPSYVLNSSESQQLKFSLMEGGFIANLSHTYRHTDDLQLLYEKKLVRRKILVTADVKVQVLEESHMKYNVNYNIAYYE
ncbi:RHS repeat-associated core domain-containing protein [Cysteiniphilum sp. QT6929]|uniref:RHS repeat-associated core domain-containing protein n=1 Tax=Cysteiniphilum sp. QT6929 TaxID=2975055 RepID=UPI0024B395F1|nr:RHS repeat-associated core domain-containing protein [Cysteiniphilum sp. QT6929]WHN66539.1 RHS repeat-associated core domain-containing protein [Cysteiniphilum sp. QT6929]